MTRAGKTQTENPRLRQVRLAAAALLTVAAMVAGLLWLADYYRNQNRDTVDIAVVFSPDEDAADFLAGTRIAIEQVNADGGLLGRKVEARIYQEESYTDKLRLEKVVAGALRLASEIGRQKSILAVIGHGSSATAVPASAVYERYNKLFLATHATASSLSNHRLDLTFALQPNNADNAAFLARYAHDQGIRRVVVLSDNSGYGIETTDQFRSQLTQDGGTVLYRGRLTSVNKSIEDLLLFLMDNDLFKPADIDGVFITSSAATETAQFIIRARQLGLRMPILGPEFLYSRQIEDTVGPDAMRDVVAVSVYDGDQVTPEGIRLSTPFIKATGHPPGLMAAMGFDAVKVLAYAVRRTGSDDPAAIADTLRIIRYDAPFIGASGPVVFNSHGLTTDTAAYVVRHDGSRFRTVATYHKPLPAAPAPGDETAAPAAPERTMAK